MNINSCLIVVAVLALAGCGGAPSESDIADAFAQSMQQATQAAKASTAALGAAPGAVGDLMPKLHGVKKIGCRVAEGAEGYVCDVETDMTVPFAGRQKQASSVRMVESDDGWRVLKH